MRGRDGDDRLLDDLFTAQAASTPGATALVCGAVRLTFAELDARVRRLAVLLTRHGVRPEAPVALCLERGPDLIAGTLAVLRSGGVLVPLDPGHPAQRLAQLLADSGAPLVLTDRAAGRRLPAHGPARLYTDDAEGSGGAEGPGGAESSGNAGSPGGAVGPGDTGNPGGADGPAGTGPGPDAPVRPLPANAACLMYTSGSSGRPKGVVIPHANLVNLHFDYLARCIGPTVRAAGGRRLRVAHTLPAVFDASWAPLMWLVAGHELHVVDALTRDDPEALAELCARSRLDVLDDTPSRLRLLLRAGLLSGGGHRPLDLTVGGEALDTALCAELARADDVVCRNTYGPTEATVDALSWRVRPGAGPLIGRPVAGARERVLDRGLRPVATGETGELWLAGPGLARGYHGRPGWTARSFTADPFGPPGSRMYRTGDLVRRQADGQLEFMGRSDDQVKISGVRVEPREVEAALERHPGVERAVVVGATRPDGRPYLAAYAVVSPARREAEAPDAETLARREAEKVPSADAPARREAKTPDTDASARPEAQTPDTDTPARPEAQTPDTDTPARPEAQTPDTDTPARPEAQTPDTDTPARPGPETPGPAALRAFLAAVLPRHALPAALVVLDRLPLLPGGKVDRRALPPARPGSDRAHVPPRTADERLLAGVWERVLRVERVGAHDDFLALGGDSILAMQIVSEVRRGEEAAGRVTALHARTLFDHPTIATLAAALDAGRTAVPGRRRPDPASSPTASATRQPRHDRTLPLSPAQRRLWYLTQLRPGSTEYNTATGFRLRGRLDAAALGAALDALAARHEPLRTTFHTVDGEGVQRVGEPRPVPVGTADLTGLPEADRAAAEDRAVREELGRAFDLEHGPPLRVLVVRRDTDDHLLVLHQHHLVTDGWSVGVLTEELGALYSAALRGERARLPPLALRYADHAVRQAERAAAPEHEASLAYWRQRLAGLVPLELPTDRPRPAVRASAGAVHRFLVPAELTARLTEVGRTVGATPFMVLTAALQVLLARTTGRHDIALATVLSGRDRVELEPLAGFFAHTVVLRSQAGPALPFDGFLRAVRSTVLDAFTHGEVPYDEVVRAVRPERDASRSPLAQVALVLQNAPRPGLRMAGLRAEDAELPGLTSLFDMTWEFEPRRGALAATVQYDTDLFDPATPARLADRLGVLLAGIADDPGRPLDRLPLLPAAEVRRLARWSTGEAADLPQTTVHALVAEQARLRPGAVALSYGDTRLTYAELEARADRLAAALGAHGAGPGTVVGVLLERGADLVVSLLAVLRSGAAYLPLDPGDPAGRSAFLLADSGAALVLTRAGLRDRLPADVPRTLCVEDEPGRAPSACPARAHRAGPRDPACVFYTSGSTGSPKGVLVEHRAVVRLCRAPSLRAAPGDVLAHAAAPSFDAATYEIWGALANGARLAVRPPGVPSVQELRVFLAAERVTTLWLTAGLFHEVADADPEALGGLRRLIAGGDVLSPAHCAAVLAACPDLELFNGYGPTEGTTFTTCHRVTPQDTARSVPIGRPLAATRCHVVDARMRPVPVGVPGELLVGGAGLARGYLGRPGLTASRFVADPGLGDGPPGGRLYRTGDLVRLRDDGVLEFLGRLDAQVKIRGFRVEPGEVEAALTRDPSVAEAVVTARSDGGHRHLVAYVTGRPGGPAPTAAALRARLERTVPGHLVPARYVVLDRLPLTAHGKVDHRALPAPARAAHPAHTPPRGPVEEALCRVWSEVLGVERVGADDNFFDLGGDSILSIRAVAAARAAGIRITVEDVLLRQTVARLAATAASGPPPRPPAAPAPGPVPLTPVQHWFRETGGAGRRRFNQWIDVELADGVRPDALHRAVAAVARRHGAWRLRFSRDGLGQHTVGDDAGDGLVLRHRDLSPLDPAAQDRAMAAEIGLAQRGLRPDRGPLGRAVLFSLGPHRPARLFVTVHHLVIDGVSWQVLLAELDRAHGQAASGAPVDLGPPPVSFQDWAHRLAEYTAAGGFDPETAYWSRTAGRVRAGLPRDLDGVAGPGDERAVTVRLSAAWTEALLRDVPRAYRTQVNDVLLAALAHVLARWSGRGEVAIALEGHGREARALGGGLDLSGALGWFTTLFPVVLEVPGTPDWGALLKSVKEQLRAVPRRGIGYGALRHLRPGTSGGRPLPDHAEPSVSFNYLGRLATSDASGTLFARPPERFELFGGARGVRTRPLDVTALVADGELEFTWHHSAARHREETVRRLAVEVLEALRAIVAHCAAPGSGGATPSDFPLAGLEQAEVDRLVGDGRTVRDLLPLTPVQSGMLFHHLSAPDAGVYLEQVHLDVRGVPDPDALARAWQETVERTPELRAAVVWADAGRPLMAVHRHCVLPLAHHDWRALSPAQQQERLRDLLAADRAAPPALDRPPLMRLALVRLPGDRVRVVWTFHHVLLDGWSVFHVLADVLARYADPTAVLPARPASAEYLRRLAARDASAAAGHWRERLAGLGAATPLPFDRPPARAHRTRADTVVDARLTAAASAGLYDFARRHRVTVNAVVQGMWAVLLWQYGGVADVCFGATVSGRTPDVPGVEAMIGMFVNTVPVRVRTDPEAELAPWLAELHAERIADRRHDHVALTSLPRPGGRTGGALFDSIVVFENYPVDTAAFAALGADLAGLDAVEVTNYPLNVVVSAAEELTLRLVYDPALFDADTCRAVAGHLVALLTAAPGAARRPLSALPSPPGAGRTWAPPVVPAPPRVAGPAGHVAPRTHVERTLARILSEVLGRERVGVHDDFFDLGGDSLLSVRVTSRIRTELGVDVHPRDVFDHPTAALLAHALPDTRALPIAHALPDTRALPDAHGRPDAHALPDRHPAAHAPDTGVRAGRSLLSPGQQRLWYLYELAPDSAEYNSVLPLRLHGRLDLGALDTALTVLAERHEVLRATFDGTHQHVHPAAPVTAQATDLSVLSPDARARELARLLRAFTTEPFDLRHGPLLRVRLLRLDEDTHVLHLATHHIVCDGWSMAVLLTDLTACYEAAVRRRPPDLAPLSERYADFAERQRRRAGPDAEAGMVYWRRCLAGATPLDLPLDRPRPAAWNPAGSTERLTVDAESTRRLRVLGARSDTTLFTVLTTAVQLVLARYCAQDDVPVATVVAGRDRLEYEGLVGFFVNTVVLRTRVDEALSFAGLLARVRAGALAAFDHADTPFEQVVAALGQSGERGRPALSRVAVVLHNTPAAQPGSSGLRMTEEDIDAPAAQFDLAFEFRVRDGGLLAELRYRTDLFDAGTVAGIGRHLRAVLDAAVAAPEVPLHRVPLTDAAQRRVLIASGPVSAGGLGGGTVTELFDAVVRRAPDAPALRVRGRTTSYGELDRRARALAARLTASGVRRGDRVRVVLPPGAEAVTAFVALARIGAAYLSAEPDAPAGRLAAVAADSGAVLLLNADSEPPPAPPGASPATPPPGPDDPLAVVHTSGSTGRPKGVVLTHGGVVNLLAGYADAFPARPGERHGQVADLSFDASVGEVWAALCRGACLCVAEPALRRDPRALGRWVAEEELTLCFFPTAVGERLFADDALAGAHRLRHVLLGGERLTRLPAGPVPFAVVNGYGPAEATVFATWCDTSGLPVAEPPPIGRPLPGVRAYVLDRWLRPVPPGVTGELYLAGPGVAQGYLGAPAESARRFVADPFAPAPGGRMYRTGDLARRRADGLLEHRGRGDRQVKVSGVRVELDGIEHLLARYPGVSEAAVVAVPGDDGRLGIRAFVTGPALHGGELRAWLGRHLPRAAVPSSITPLDALPRLPSGKTDRRALAARGAPAHIPATPSDRPPGTPAEKAVAGAWTALLGREVPDVREKFFDAGGTSLQLVDLRKRLEEMSGRSLSVVQLLEHPTVEAMARLVDESAGSNRTAGHDL